MIKTQPSSHFLAPLLALLALMLAACAGGPDNDEAPAPEIGELGGMCGGIAGFQCKAEGTYCKVEPGVCADTADYAGVCVARPEICTMEYDPVCGCDGETYGNACSAAGKGVSVAYKGECRAAD